MNICDKDGLWVATVNDLEKPLTLEFRSLQGPENKFYTFEGQEVNGPLYQKTYKSCDDLKREDVWALMDEYIRLYGLMLERRKQIQLELIDSVSYVGRIN